MFIVKELSLYIFLSIFLFKIFNKYISKFIVDRPVYRSSHFRDIPTSSGIIFILIYVIYVILNREYSLLILVPLGILGFFDDVFNIKQVYRLFFQTINILFISFSLLNFNIFTNLQLSNGIILFIYLSVGLILVNCINFMDGMDGLVASNIFLILLNNSLNNSFDLIAIPIVLGVFLFYNWYPAKIFMGDSGSTFLGLLLFYIAFSENDFNSTLVLLFTASPLLMDSLICILRRIKNKENIFSPHKKHLYQRLHQNGMNHQEVAIIYAFSTSILLVFSYTNNLIIMSGLTFLIFTFGIYLERNYAKPFNT